MDFKMSELPKIIDEPPYIKENRKSDYLTATHNRHSISWIWPIIAIAVGCLIYYLVHLNDHILPRGITADEADENPSLFSGERSRASLRRLTKLGPRVVGDIANEILAPNIILAEANDAEINAHTSQFITVLRQKGSGAYQLGYLPSYTNIYDKVQNILVKIAGSDGRHSIMVNCHYDTVPEADGASDDGINCAIMLELIRVLSKSETQLKHNIIFLFNGAEEVGLQASHLFLQHPWANDTSLFINLESAGLGGRSILFQTGPKNSWIFKTYAKHVPHPHGQIMGEEMFQARLIPSDTDFRIFRDFGNMPGLDFAFCRNGFVYHTKYDSEEYIPVGSHQHLGDNILALIKALGNADEVYDMKSHSEGQMVYYDYLGWFMISYTAETAVVINIIISLMAILSIFIYIGRIWNVSWLPFSTWSSEHDASEEPRHHMTSKWGIFKELGFAVGSRLFGMLLGIAITAIVALIIDSAASLKMPWYSNSWLIFPLYWCPCLIGYSLPSYLTHMWRKKKHGLSLSLTSQLDIISTQIIWILIFFISTCLGIRSSSVLFFPVTCATVANLLIFLTPLYLTVHKWIWAYLLIHIPAILMNMYTTLIVYIIFVPIMARSGVINGDLYIGIVTSFLCLYVSGFVISLITLVRKPVLVYSFIAIFSIAMIIISLTSEVGQPYRSGPTNPSPQRYWIMHSLRERNSESGVRTTKTGYFVLNLDSNSPNTLPLKFRSNLESLSDDCENELTCGLPFYSTRMIPLSKKSSWIPAEAPVQPITTELIRHSKDCDMTSLTCTMSFGLKGPDRMTLTFVPRPDIKLVDWSLPSPIEVSHYWKGQPAYFLNIVRGELKLEFPISLTFKMSLDKITNNSPILDIGLSGNHVHHLKDRTEAFQAFLDSLPEWTMRTGWISAYKSYVF